MKERKAEIDAELEPLRCKEWQAYEQCNAEFRKQERYCQEQRKVLRALEDLKEQERMLGKLTEKFKGDAFQKAKIVRRADAKQGR